MKKSLDVGIIRVRAKNLEAVIKTKKGWKKTNFDVSHLKKIAELFKAHNNFKILIDNKSPEFLKGFVIIDGKVRGQRIDVLPDNTKLDKAYSLFSPDLTVHDEATHLHWDVIYKNPNGKYAYLYSLNKKKKSQSKKYKRVELFDRKLPVLKKNLIKALKKGELIALPMYTLLKTYIRVGNEMYYKIDGHKGLTTLQKKDIKINDDNVTFSFLAKDGVPQKITEEFPEDYVKQLKEKICKLKNNDFIFCNSNGNLLKENDFQNAFERYCGERFYPHIVRSHYATFAVKDFINKIKTPTKNQVKELFLSIADKLGHKKFSKKKNEWQSCSVVTIHHYVEPKLVERLHRFL